MREVWLDHSEVMNSTEILLVYKTKFNRQEYGAYVIINIASRVPDQDEWIAGCIESLQNIDRSVASKAEKVE